MAVVWLVGMMGVGKTTVGRLLAERLGIPFIDVDEVIVRRMGCSIGELWGERGEAAFRDLEAATIAAYADHEAVIATGGGAVLRPTNVTTMRASGPIVWLDAHPAELAARLGPDDVAARPLLTGGPVEALMRLADERAAAYEAAADLQIDTTERDPTAVAEEVAAWLDTS